MGLFRFDWRRASLAFYLQIRIFRLLQQMPKLWIPSFVSTRKPCFWMSF